MAQASVQAAIYILVHEGFVTKAGGRSARVVNLSEKEVLDIYELRGALEGFGGAACDGEDGGSFWVAAAG